jgi:hypothetical protein
MFKTWFKNHLSGLFECSTTGCPKMPKLQTYLNQGSCRTWGPRTCRKVALLEEALAWPAAAVNRTGCSRSLITMSLLATRLLWRLSAPITDRSRGNAMDGGQSSLGFSVVCQLDYAKIRFLLPMLTSCCSAMEHSTACIFLYKDIDC